MSQNNGYNLKSPAVQRDFEDLLKTNPDIYTVVDWLKNNVNPDNLIDTEEVEPETLYSEKLIDEMGKRWAGENGYYENISDFPEHQKDSWIEENDLVKKDEVEFVDVETLMKEDPNLNLSCQDGSWIVWNIYEHKELFTAESIGELNDEIKEHFAKIEEDKKRSWELALKAREERAKMIEESKKAKSKTGGHRGRPKGSKNKKS